MGDGGSLTFKMDKKGATLTLGGPDVKVGPAKLSPTIGVQRDDQGRYHFVVGHKESVIAPAQLPERIRKALKSLGSGKGGPATPVRMPSCGDLIKHDRVYVGDPPFIDHGEYVNRRVSRLAKPGQLVWWPMMTQGEYKGYVSLCKLALQASRSAAGN